MSDPQYAAKYYNNLDFKYLQCRSYGHAWRPSQVIKNKRLFEIITICRDCGAWKKEILNSSGEALSRPRVSYPEGYVNEGGGSSLVGKKGIAKIVLSVGPVSISYSKKKGGKNDS